MSDKKIIAVVGATGAQGGGLARAILADSDGPFAVRALTRDPSSDAARTLADAGAEVVQADLDDLDSLVQAFDGAWGVFALTNFWEHFSPEKEKQQAKNQADAAARAGVKHVVWSTLDDTREHLPVTDDRMPTLMGEYNVPHFDAKGEADAYFREAGVPTTFLRTVFYWENFIFFGQGPTRGEDGTLRLTIPMGDARLPAIAVDDIGKVALGIFRAGPEEMAGRTIGICGDQPTGEEMAATLGEVLGEEVRYEPVSPDVYRSFDFPGADDMGNMYQFKTEFEDVYTSSRSVEQARALNPALQSFAEWARGNAGRIPID